MQKNKVSLKDAFDLILNLKKDINISEIFMKCLEEYENKLNQTIDNKYKCR